MRFFDGKISDQGAIDAGGAGDAAELGEAHAEDGIEVREDDEAGGLGVLSDFRGKFQDVLKRRAVFQSAFARALDDRPIGDRVAKRDPEFNDPRARVNGREDNFFGCSEIRISAGDIDDEGWLAIEMERHGSIVDAGRQISEADVFAAN